MCPVNVTHSTDVGCDPWFWETFHFEQVVKIFKCSFDFSSSRHFVQWSKTMCAILIDGFMGTFVWKYFKFGRIVQEVMTFKNISILAILFSRAHHLSYFGRRHIGETFVWNCLRKYANKYFPHWNLFNTLHTVCFMHGLSIYEIKRICQHAHFFIIQAPK